MNYLSCDQPWSFNGLQWVCNGTTSSFAVPPAFDVNQLDPVAVVESVSAGFIVAGVPFLVVMLARIVVKNLKPTHLGD